MREESRLVRRVARVRTVLVVLPITGAVGLLLGFGLFRPEVLDPGLAPSALVALVVGVGAVATTLLEAAAVRCTGRLRLSWSSLCAGGALWTVSRAGAALDWDAVLVWGYLRGAAFLAVGVALLTAPGVRRTLHEWGLLLLDGWLIGVSIFLVGWVALRLTGSSMVDGGPVPPALYWVPVDLLVASVTAGLAMRTTRRMRAPVLLLVLACLLAVTGDSTSALAGGTQFGDAQWMIMMFALGGVTVSHRLDFWAVAGSDPSEPQHARPAQVAVIPGLLALVVEPFADVVKAAAALSAIVVLAVEMLLVHRQNRDLWRTMRRQSARLDQLVRESRDAIVQVGAHGQVEFMTDAMAHILGRDPASLLGLAGHDLIHPEDQQRVAAEIGRLDEVGEGGLRVTGRFLHRDGTWRCLELNVSPRTGGAPGFTVSVRDITERMRMESELRQLASTDTLTGLLNRQTFLARLERELLGGDAIVLFIDLDHFKSVNDMNGHAVGDRLLREAAEGIQLELRAEDVAARLGGDEFAVLAAGRGPSEAGGLACRIIEHLSGVGIGASVGVAFGLATPTDAAVSAEMLLGDADLAMYEAKSAGGRRWVVFEPAMRARVVERARMSAALERASTGEGLYLLVQPIVALADGSWVGFEALARWQDGERQRQPGEFLPLAEETGLIVAIGTWVLREALGWLAAWPERDVGISVNIAGRQVASPGFAELVCDELARCGISPPRLTLEITEQTAVEDLERTSAVLQPLRSLGVHLALDDFGTGFSSLGYLAQLPVDELKIDRRFVAGVGVRPEDDALVRAVIGLAEDLGLRVVAEGVETPQQASALMSWGCSFAQGYRFRRPTPMNSIHQHQPRGAPPQRPGLGQRQRAAPAPLPRAPGS